MDLAAEFFLTMFRAYAVIAFDQGRMDLVVFLSANHGFIWSLFFGSIFTRQDFSWVIRAINVVGVVLGVIAMLTNTPFLLIPIGIIFIIESGSVIIQLASKN